MHPSLLEKLGLTVRQTSSGTEAELEPTGSPLFNPLARRALDKVTFSVLNDRLVVKAPPELVGTQPLSLAAVSKQADLEQLLSNSLSEHLFHLQRRSGELQTLGLSPAVDPETLQLTATLSAGAWTFQLQADKRGNFRVGEAARDGQTVEGPGPHVFELSEFRESQALADYLIALYSEQEAAAPPVASPAPAAPLLTFGDLVSRFGGRAVVPPRSPVEVLVEVRVGKERYRFAAARLSGTTFRGMLAGQKGKLWAERFALESFQGVAALVAKLLKVSPSDVELTSPGEDGA
jgi:hypothetical protein